jgi:hypothetical protein
MMKSIVLKMEISKVRTVKGAGKHSGRKSGADQGSSSSRDEDPVTPGTVQ